MENTDFKFIGNFAIQICFKIINIINEKQVNTIKKKSF